jgi:serpin B
MTAPQTREISRRSWLGAGAALAVGALTGAGLAGCGRAGSSLSPTATVPGVDQVRSTRSRDAAAATDLPAASGAVQDFSAELARRLLAGGGNLICSPLSVHLALAMTLLGARGTTASELAAVLHTDDPARLAGGLNVLSTTLARRAGQVTVGDQKLDLQLDLANALWGQRGIGWQPAFLDALATDFGAGMRTVDFAADPEQARRAINAWVGQVTRGTIGELIGQGALHSDTRLALVNALHLKAPWLEPFDQQSTRPGTFTLTGGRTVSAELMSADPTTASYTRAPGWQAVTLPYAGENLAMTLVLPDPGRAGTLAQTLDGAGLRRMITAPERAAVQVTLPRWKARTSSSLQSPLEALGAKTLFTDAADLSGMTGTQRLAVDAVLHQGYIAVDEIGTEASAATAVLARAVSAPAEVFTLRFDRPFLYVVHDVATAVPLFLGRVADPTTT